MSTLIAKDNNGDLADVEFDFVQVTTALPINSFGSICFLVQTAGGQSRVNVNNPTLFRFIALVTI
jgi:hypothetical protein